MNVHAERFPLIDSLRAIAALSVLAAHAALFAGLYTSSSLLRPYVSQLGAGVTVFYVISGFLLYRPFARAALGGEPLPRTGAYAWRRFLRIVPAYWVALTAIALVFSMSSVVTPLWHAAVLYGFGQVYSVQTIPLGLYQAGTLCVEVTFYAFVPLWALAMRGRGFRGQLAALGGLWLFSLAWKLFAFGQVSPFSRESGPWLATLPGVLDQFAVGMTLALVSARGLPRALAPAVRRAWPWWLTATAAYLSVGLLVGIPRLDTGGGPYILLHELLTVFAASLIVPAAFAWERRDAVRRLLARRALLYLGLVSYGIYLWHYAIVQHVSFRTRDWMVDTLGLGPSARFVVLLAVGMAGSVAIASVSYYVVERPFLSLKRLVRRGPDRAEPSEAISESAPAPPVAIR
jgi:peptidoglycan/LPS O-acetylase OafA/YrhL